MKAKITHSVTEYIQKNLARKNVLWAFRDGKWFFSLFPGIWMHQESFDEYFPKYEYKQNPRSLDNPDKSYIL
jgi:hypothetical protein